MYAHWERSLTFVLSLHLFHILCVYELRQKEKAQTSMHCMHMGEALNIPRTNLRLISPTVYIVAAYACLSYDVASGSEITPCNKINKPLVAYRFTGNIMTSVTTLDT